MNMLKFMATGLMIFTVQACSPNIEHRAKPPLIVDTFTVMTAIETQVRTFNGQVIPPELTPLAFRLEGEILDVIVHEGDAVKKGQLLAMLDDAKLKQSLVDTQAKLSLVRRQLDRGKELRPNEMISGSELDELLANYKLALANAELAQVQLNYTRLKAPFDGIVSQVSKQNFERTTAGETVLSVYENANVYVEISVSDTVLTSLKPLLNNLNYQAITHFSGSNKEYPLRYLEHTSELNPQSQTYQFWLSMPQVSPAILPGNNAQVRIDMAKSGITLPSGYQIPMTAIDTASLGRFQVWKIQQDKAVPVTVQIESVNSTGAIAISGLREGDVLVNSNLRKLRAGMSLEEPRL